MVVGEFCLFFFLILIYTFRIQGVGGICIHNADPLSACKFVCMCMKCFLFSCLNFVPYQFSELK